MKQIQMVDLYSQYEKIKDRVDSAIASVIRSSAFIHGPEVKYFEDELKQYLNVKHVIAAANGTEALQIALMALDLKRGDEVITPTMTFISTAEVVALLGLKLIFVDSLPDTFNMNPQAIERAITKRTKAIIPVHLFGQCADMNAIMRIAKNHNVSVIEDNAQAIGADYTMMNGEVKKSGTIGHIGCTSFFPSKNLGAYGDGGAIFTNHDRLADKIRLIANHGQKKRYYFDAVGVNSRLDSIQAAILRIKLKELDNYVRARQKAADFYDAAFSKNEKITVPCRDPRSTHVFHQYTVKLNGVDRDGLQEHLKKDGIPSAVYYPVPLHLQKAFKSSGFRKGSFPVAEKISRQVLSLPIHTELDEEQLSFITSKVLEYCN